MLRVYDFLGLDLAMRTKMAGECWNDGEMEYWSYGILARWAVTNKSLL
jgi:hypothetical protein